MKKDRGVASKETKAQKVEKDERGQVVRKEVSEEKNDAEDEDGDGDYFKPNVAES